MKRIPLPEPSEREKRQIIFFLNEKYKKIDAVISKTIDSIGEYKKFREGI